MPNITVDVHGDAYTVTRKSAMGVVYDLIEALGLPYNVAIKYPGTQDSEDIPISGNDAERQVNLDPHMKVMVGVRETYLDNDVATMIQRANEHPPVFFDPILGVRLAPVYARSEVTIEMTVRFMDRSTAEQNHNRIRRRASLFRDGLFHEINYNYLLPKVQVLLLSEIYKLREQQAGYGEDMHTWFQNHFSDQVTVLANRAGAELALSKEEVQTGIMGRYDFSVAPEAPEASGESKGTWLLNFTYTYQYDKIISTTMKYPILVHNLPLSSKLYDQSVPYEMGERLQLPSKTRAFTDHFSRNLYVTGFPMGAPIPDFNDWLPTTVPSSLEGLLRIMIMVDPSNPRALLNLNDLGTLEIKEFLLDYARLTHDKLTQPRMSVLFVALYENDKMLGHDALSVDDELNVTTTFDLNLRHSYQVMIGLLTNWHLLPTAAIDVLRKHGQITQQLLLGIDPTLTSKQLPELMSNNYISRTEMTRAMDLIHSKRVPMRGEAMNVNFTIGHYVVTV